MSVPKPYSGTSAARLTEMVNRANASAFVYNYDFTFGSPEAVSGEDGANTSVKMIPLRALDRYDSVELRYTRLPISVLELLAAEFSPVPIHVVPFNTLSILPQINAALGINLLPGEVDNVIFEEELPSYTLTIKEGSLGWLPSSFEFSAEHIPGVPLSSVITVTTLSGLTYHPQ